MYNFIRKFHTEVETMENKKFCKISSYKNNLISVFSLFSLAIYIWAVLHIVGI